MSVKWGISHQDYNYLKECIQQLGTELEASWYDWIAITINST